MACLASFARKQFPSFLTSLVGLWILTYPVDSTTVSPTEKAPLQHKVVCQGQKLKIKCFNSSYRLNIQGGTYGRTLPGSVVCKYRGHENDFYFNCGSNDVKDKLVDLCENKKKCTFVVGKSLFGDRCRGQAYLEIIYRCVERERKKNRYKTPTTSVTTLSLQNVTTATTTTTVVLRNASYVNVTEPPDAQTVVTYEKPGIMMSMIMWVVYVKERWSSFRKVFLVSIGASFGLFLIITFAYLFCKREKTKKKKRQTSDNKEFHHQLNPVTTINGDVKRYTHLETLPNTFPAPISTLPPPPDDLIYPSPSPEMINATRPPPPPVHRGSSMDDISKLDQARNAKNVEITRSMSMRARPSDYCSKDLNYDRFNPVLQPIECGCPEINAVLTNKESAMYMNPMYENGHIKEVTC